MKNMIGKKYIVTVGNGWYMNGTQLEIIDHRLSRTIIEKFQSDEHEYNKCYEKNECPSNQTSFQYEFVLKMLDGKDIGYTQINDMTFLDYAVEFCEELKDD